MIAVSFGGKVIALDTHSTLATSSCKINHVLRYYMSGVQNTAIISRAVKLDLGNGVLSRWPELTHYRESTSQLS